MKKRYKKILAKIKAGLENSTYAKKQCLQYICDILRQEVDHYDWVGFYLLSDKITQLLELGPFSGAPTDHTEIPFGKGVCGQVAEKEETMVIQDVQHEDNYLACSLDVKSEIVVPIIKNGKFVGELDIDSHQSAPFGLDDKKFLRKIIKLLLMKNCI